MSTLELVAQQERTAISRRSREALLAARARGVRLGNPNGAAALRRAGAGALAFREAVAAIANQYAAGLAVVVPSIRAEGHSLLRQIAEQINPRGILSRRGRRWSVSKVRNLLGRLNRMGGAKFAAA